VELARKVRYRIDQELARRNIDPLFKENYRAFDKEEFLLDSDVEFFKIKKLLEKNPKLLKEDPLLSIDYLKVINLIKRKKLVENTSDQYNPLESFDSTYLDINMIDYDKIMKEEKEKQKFDRDLFLDQTGGGDKGRLEDEE
jgi:hypothetical protein